MAKFDIPASPTFNYLDLNDLKGLDSCSIAPNVMRASDMINIVKKDGLHCIRSAIEQKYIVTPSSLEEDDANYSIKYVGKVEEYDGSNPVPYYIKISERLGVLNEENGSSLYISVWPTPLVKNIGYDLSNDEGLENYKISYKKFDFTNYGESGNRAGLYEYVDFDDRRWVFTPIGILSFNCSTEILEDGKRQLNFDVVNVLDNPYTPTIVIGSKPDGTDFTKKEDINLLNNKRKVQFLGDETSTDYQLPETNIIESSVKVKTLQENGTYKELETGFTVEHLIGKVKFTTAPGKSPVDGMDNVIIEYEKNPVLSGEENEFSLSASSTNNKVTTLIKVIKGNNSEDVNKIDANLKINFTKGSGLNSENETLSKVVLKIVAGKINLYSKELSKEEINKLNNGETVNIEENITVDSDGAKGTRTWTATLSCEYITTTTTGSKAPGSAEGESNLGTQQQACLGFSWIGMKFSAKAVATVGNKTDGSDSYWTVYVYPQVWVSRADYLDTGSRSVYGIVDGTSVYAGETGYMNMSSTQYPSSPLAVSRKIPYSSSKNGSYITVSASCNIDAWLSGNYYGSMTASGASIKLPKITLPRDTTSTSTSTTTDEGVTSYNEGSIESHSNINYENIVPGSARLACYYGTKCVTVYGYESDRRIFLTDGSSTDTFSGLTLDGTSSIYYFPDTNYRVLGEDTEILGYAQKDGYLFTFKKGDDSVYVRYGTTLNDVVEFPASVVTKNLQVLSKPIQINDELLLITRDGIKSMSYTSNECRANLRSYYINNYFQLSSDYDYDYMQWYVEDNILHILINEYDFVADLSLKTYVREGEISGSRYTSTLSFQYDWYVCKIPTMNTNFRPPHVIVYQPKDFERQEYGIVYETLRPIAYNKVGIYEFDWNTNKVDKLMILKDSNVEKVYYPIKAHYITPFLDFGMINVAKTIKYVYINTRSKNSDAFLIGYINEEGYEETMEKIYSGINDYTTSYRNTKVPFPKLIQIKSKIKKFMNIKLYVQNIADTEENDTITEDKIAEYGDMTFNRILIQYQLSGKYRGE